MVDGPAIPWGLAEKIYGAYQTVAGRKYSLEDLAARGGWMWADVGFWWVEAYRVGWRPK